MKKVCKKKKSNQMKKYAKFENIIIHQTHEMMFSHISNQKEAK